jgi:hypothetical protein
MAAAKRGYAEVLNNLTAPAEGRFTRLILKTKRQTRSSHRDGPKSLKLWKLLWSARGLVVMAKAMTLAEANIERSNLITRCD